MQLAWPANMSRLESNHNTHLTVSLGWTQTVPLAFQLQNVGLLLLISLIASQTESSVLCLHASRNDAVWVFSPACNASQLCCIQTASISHILSLR
jgi:hypothetical protein